MAWSWDTDEDDLATRQRISDSARRSAAKNLVKKVDIGLNKGLSWERISKDTGVPLDLVRQYSNKTRPNYGIKKPRPPKDNRDLLQKIGDFTEESNKAFMGTAVGGLADVLTFATGKLTGVSDKDIAKSQKEVRQSIGATELTPLEKLGKTPQQIQQEIIKNRTDPISLAGRNVGAGQRIAADIATTVIPGAAAEKALRGTQIANRFMQGGKLAKIAGETGVSVGSGAAATAAGILKDPSQLTAENVGTNVAIDAAIGAAVPIVGQAYRGVRGLAGDNSIKTLSAVTQEKKVYDALKQAEKSKQKVSSIRKVTDFARREAFDKSNYFARADRFEAKTAGRTLDDQRASNQSLTDLTNKYHAIDAMGEVQLGKKYGKNSITDFIKKDGVDTPAAVSRNQFLTDMYDMEVRNMNRNKKGIATKSINRSLDDATLAQRIDEYKLTHPDWEDSLKVSKGLMDDFIDIGVAHGVIKKDVAKFVKGRYKVAAPIERLFDDELVRPIIQGGMKTNVGKSRILQALEGSDAEINLGYDRFINRTKTAMSEAVRNDIDNEIRRRGEAGTLIGGYKTILDPDKTMRFEALKSLRDEANASMEKTRKQLGTKTGQLRVQNAFTAPLRREAAKLTRAALADSEDEGIKAAADSLTDKEAFEIFGHITGDTKIDALRNKLIKSKAGKETQNLLDDIVGLKEQYQQAKLQSQEAFSGMAENSQKVPTNVNAITGFKEGYKFKGEIDPQLAKALEQITGGKAKDVLKYANIPSAAQKVFWTTNPLTAPVFTLMRTIYEPMLMATTSKARIRDLVDPRTIKEAFSKEFGQQIYSGGAVREGVLSTARDTQTSARALAVQGIPKSKQDIKNIVDLTIKNPKVAASKLSEVGSLYSNALRRWSSAATKRRFLKQYNDEGKALNVAIHDYNEVLGNFQRASNAARAVEAVLPYTVAGQAGARQLGKAIRERPLETGGRLLAFAGAATMGANALMETPEGQKYVQEQYETDRALNIDGFITIPLPGGPRRNVDKDGKVTWDNIIKIKLPPDFRTATALINRGMYGAKTGDWSKLDAGMVASSIFGAATGGQLIDSNTGRVDLPGALAGGTPGIGQILAGVDPESGELLKEGREPSDIAKRIGELTGGAVDPYRFDALLGRGGSLGSAIRKGDAGTILKSIQRQTVETSSKSHKSIWQDRFSEVIKERESVNERINKLITESGGQEGKKLAQADKLAFQFNKKVDKLEKQAKEDPELKTLTDKQKAYLSGLRYSMEGKYISQRSINSRLGL